ncbi:Flagellar motor switch protein FliN [Caloramator mitchellensis]|uniref:Flagellar motor switch protein FliN n=1 Tax=Caloramator mitchellensis TaxID=908809 RepID=A0A0R3JRD1_CALMK|nr:flagellar motor switch phosphatase FliY [Caloramator mitchellensis]KRQ85992.1 Flagellar motor switch protein FliN [Caloramator mitchellensis]
MHDGGILSQAEIDALLRGVGNSEPQEDLTEEEKDLLGEIGNISMGSASTALSTIIGRIVNITTPRVSVTTLNQMKAQFSVPLMALEVEYIEGLKGSNLFLVKITDASIIADIMMGGTGANVRTELTEIEISAVQEAMNQMIGSSATSLSTMLNFPINITPPVAKLWGSGVDKISDLINEDEKIVKISFRLTIEELLDSEIMLLLPIKTAKAIISKMSGGPDLFENELEVKQEAAYEKNEAKKDITERVEHKVIEQRIETKVEPPKEQVNVSKATFAELKPVSHHEKQNIDLILDVPLEISVVLGRTKKTIKEILELGQGSLIELDKLTEEPVEILVNGKRVAYGEVVVIDENFGVRITSIISNIEKVKSLQG